MITRTRTALAAFGVALFAISACGTAGESASVETATDPASTVGLASFDGGCAGSVVAVDGARPSDAALFLTNGHCDTDRAVYGRANVDQPGQASAVISTGSATPGVAAQVDRRLYWTMTGTDVALFRLQRTYGDLADRGIKPFRLSDRRPETGERITVATPTKPYRCTVARTVPTVMEMGLQTNDALAYSPECDTVAGTSGAPVLDEKAQIIGINNSHNTSGGQCTRNEPCEVSREGVVTVSRGTGYAPPVRGLVSCLTGTRLDLGKEGCSLPKP